MANEPVGFIEGRNGSATAVEEGPFRGDRRRTDRVLPEDPSAHFILDTPKRRTKFKSWFALAIFMGVLMALAVVAITM